MNSIFFDKEIFIIPEAEDSSIEFSESSDMLIVCNTEDLEKNKQLLTNILNAISRKENENVDIHCLDNEETLNLAKSLNKQIKYVICFGLKPKNISMNAGFRANKFYQTESFSIMLSHSLGQLESEKKYKKALWEALQNAFVSKPTA